MNRKAITVFLGAVLAALPPAAAFADATRTYVSNNGNDANSAYSCDYAHPCRTFAVALGQTVAGGEILAIDSSGYGRVTIDRSVSIIAAPGVYAGIGVGSAGNATGVQIATAGVNVVLRGLTINGMGGTYGVSMTNGSKLAIEDCVISNFTSGGRGVYVNTAATVRIVNSLFRDNTDSVLLSNGANASISQSQFYGSTDLAVWVTDAYGGASVTTAAYIDRSVASGGNGGFAAQNLYAANTSRLVVTDSVVSKNSNMGVQAYAASGTAYVSVRNTEAADNYIGLESSGTGAKLVASNNVVVGNYYGLFQMTSGVIDSAGDNVVHDNGLDGISSITTTFLKK